MNFLTAEYLKKLAIEQYLRKCLGVLIISAGIIYLIFLGLKPIESSIEADIARENNQIKIHSERIKEINEEISKETNVGAKIEIIEDIFSQEHLRVSEIIKSLDQDAPSNIWIESLIYDKGQIRIKGVSLDGFNINSEENTYSFEQRLENNDLYKEVTLSYIKKATRYSEEVNEFEYILILR